MKDGKAQRKVLGVPSNFGSDTVKIAVIQPFLLCRIDRMAQSTKRNLEFKLIFALFFVILFIIYSVVSM